jgi:hypothetical protein
VISKGYDFAGFAKISIETAMSWDETTRPAAVAEGFFRVSYILEVL